MPANDMTSPGNSAARLHMILCVAFAVAASTSPVEAFPDRNYVAVQWDHRNGLPPGPAATMLQTRDGFLWFGMEEGLAQFDGISCTIFDSRNQPEFAENRVSSLFEDHAGNLWIGVGTSGLLRYANGTFTRYTTEHGLSNGAVIAMVEQGSATLWVGTDGGGLFYYDGNQFHSFPLDEAPEAAFIQSVAIDPDSALWVLSKDALRRIDNFTLTDRFSVEAAGSSVRCLRIDRSGRFWVGGSGGLFQLRDGALEKVPGQPTLRTVNDIAESPDGALWIGSITGLYRFHGGRFDRFAEESGFTGTIIHKLYCDHEGSLWTASQATGVEQLKPARFNAITPAHGLSHRVATSILEDRHGAIWIATEHGINRWFDQQITSFTTDHGLVHDLAFTLCEDGDGALWIGTHEGISRLDGNRFTNYLWETGLPNMTAWCSYADPQGGVWFGTARGLAHYHQGQFRLWTHENSGLSHDDVRSIARDNHGRLWVGTSYGLNRLEGDRFVNFYDAGPDEGFNVVLTLHFDDQGDLWFGTMGRGLFRHRAGTFFRFTTRHGLFDTLIHQILEDDHGYLWMSCNRGLFRVRKTELHRVAAGQLDRVTSTIYGIADGMPSIECIGTIQPAGSKSRDGRLWFPTTAGVVVINPDRLHINLQPPPVHIQAIKVDGRLHHPTQPLRVHPGTERIEIHYAVLSFLNPAHLTSRYTLEGLDRGWITNTAQRVASYTHVPPGHYRFRVAAANNDGVWNTSGATLALVVQPFFWQTVWFRALSSVALLGAAAGLSRIVMDRKHRRELHALEQRHTLERERSRIAADLHDDLGSNLGSIALLSEAAGSNATSEDAAEFAEIHRLATETAEAMRDIVWFINPDEATAENIAIRMRETAINLLRGIPLTFECDRPLPTQRLSPEFKRQFFLLYKECLHNIHKHARATRVNIQFRHRNDLLELILHDNGVGFRPPSHAPGRTSNIDPEQPSTFQNTPPIGHGFINMRRRAMALNGSLGVESQPNRGTTIRFTVPLSRNSVP
jgi:ligand-binding sensor domain-containing protein/signal transduction histidine kinase